MHCILQLNADSDANSRERAPDRWRAKTICDLKKLIKYPYNCVNKYAGNSVSSSRTTRLKYIPYWLLCIYYCCTIFPTHTFCYWQIVTQANKMFSKRSSSEQLLTLCILPHIVILYYIVNSFLSRSNRRSEWAEYEDAIIIIRMFEHRSNSHAVGISRGQFKLHYYYYYDDANN